MKAKALLLSGLCFALLVGSMSGATIFRISIAGQADIFTTTRPVESGSVVLVRRLSDGQMTAVPSELVRAVSTVPSSAAVKLTNLGTGGITTTLAAKPATTLASGRAAGLLPGSLASGTIAGGTLVVLGPTGGSARTSLSTDTLAISAARAGAATVSTPATSLEAQVFRGDLPRLTPRGAALTLGTNAAATPASALPEIGPNGFPVFANVPVPALATVGPNGFLTTTTTGPPLATVGPNGFLTTATTGPQSGFQPIAPNGFPDTSAAPVAQTGLTIGGASAATVPQTTAPASSSVTTGAPATAGAGAASASPQ
jgi:hypothetical protein